MGRRESLQIKKEINSIFLSKVEKESDFKAKFTQTILVHRDSVSFDKDREVYNIEAYIVDFLGKLDNRKINENIVYTKVFEMAVDQTNPEKTNKLISKIFKTSKGLKEITVEGELVEGQSMTKVSADDIPNDIKELIEYGAITLEDYQGRAAIGGNKEKKMVIKTPSIKFVEKDGAKSPVILMEESKYQESDLVFLHQFLEEEIEELEEDSDEDDSEDLDDDLMSLLND